MEARAKERLSRTLIVGKRHLVLAVSVLAFATSFAIPASAGAESPLSIPGMTLVFGGSQARGIGNDSVAVPVKCLGEERGFCSGVLTLSRNGHRNAIPFSVRGGSHEFLLVPLRHHEWKGHPRKVRGLATTAQPLGGPSVARTLFYAHSAGSPAAQAAGHGASADRR